ncbi:MAG: flavin reductase [Deltaproteobacteria bacterium]|nr:flavin reductase [Deltaproteobacteria bacterium]MBW2113085.1 flavin reductase [Deltaproteobacteria bacterium]MBW2354236.1 flavin reductase [Deltaproteobacteria bacterium]
MEKEWIQALGKMTYGIYILTSSHEDKINGMIASWVSQVSYDPLLIMVAVHPNRYSHRLIEQGGCFALHVMARDQADLMQRFKGPDPLSKFDSIEWERGKTGCPIVSGCVACFECEVRASYTPGNHTLFLGEVVEARAQSGREALSTLDYDGVYLGRS